MVRIRPLTYEDVVALLPHLTEHSCFETVLTASDTPEKVWELIQRTDGAWLGLIAGKAVCAYGIVRGTFASGTVTLWMLVSQEAINHPFLFIRHSRLWLQRLAIQYPVVRCFVNSDAPSRERWMSLLRMGEYSSEFGYIEYRLRNV